MPARPGRSRLRQTGGISGGWLPATPPARRPGSEIRARDTLGEATQTRSRTWVRFPPSPYSARPSGRASHLADRDGGGVAAGLLGRRRKVGDRYVGDAVGVEAE